MVFGNINEEKVFLRKISSGDRIAFAQLFTSFYNDLVFFATRFTSDLDTSEEIVQSFFVKFWEERQSIIINSSLKSFMLKSIQNRCFDWLRHKDVRNRYAKVASLSPNENSNETENYLFFHELEAALELHLHSIPPDDADIFRMNRFEGLTYAQIAHNRKISIRVVELRISKVLKVLRMRLKDFYFFCNFF